MTWVCIAATSLRPGPLDLDREASHYLGRVLRSRPGDNVTLFDGQGRVGQAVVKSLTTAGATVEVDSIETHDRPRGRLIAEVAMIKGERMDLCVQKLTELGVDAIVPVLAARSVVKLDPARQDKRLRRYRDIIRAAAAQAENPWPPTIEEPRAVADLPAAQGPALVMVSRAEGQPLVGESFGTGELRFCIGPEGGWDGDEKALLVAKGYRPTSLGPGVLRAETAAITAAAMLRPLMGRCE
ncbi:MAG: 16S rRNA (uracil(1498)-N(3))-methyltransferase [Deltaproteobacteria bacterium]|nr:16S rRNA (uracil(1498)-N(3))-methyltransferase [Deltaproteobacteria bacterium]